MFGGPSPGAILPRSDDFVKAARVVWVNDPLRETIPIFPLQNVVLFPRILTPLHLFEERYRQMAADALSGGRRIAMVTVVPESVEGMAGDPEIYPVGCAGVITESQKLDDGRYNIVLLGTHRVRILDEPERTPDRLYRVAEVERLEDPYDPGQAQHVASLRTRIIELVGDIVGAGDPDRGAEMTPEMFQEIDDAALVNSLSNAFPFAPAEKQGLLEANTIPERFERLEGVLSFLHAERDGLKGPNSRSVH